MTFLLNILYRNFPMESLHVPPYKMDMALQPRSSMSSVVWFAVVNTLVHDCKVRSHFTIF